MGEKLLAFKFLLHFVGDVHQPLHAADDHDRGGNDKFVIFAHGTLCTKLHSYWDTVLVQRLGWDFKQVGRQLSSDFSEKRNTWMSEEPEDWARGSFEIARDVVYSCGHRFRMSAAINARYMKTERSRPLESNSRRLECDWR